MEERTLIMPFRIVVFEKPPFAKEDVLYYDKAGRPLYSMILPQTPVWATVRNEFTEKLYIDILSIQNPDDARVFVAAHPTLRFAWKHASNTPYFPDYLSEDDYYSFIVHSVKEYNYIRKLISSIEEYQKSKKDHSRVAVAEIEKLFCQHLSLFGETEHSWEQQLADTAGGGNTEFMAEQDAHEAFLHANGGKTDYDEDKEWDFVCQYLADHHDEITEMHKYDIHMYARYMIDKVFAFVQRITDRANIAYNIDSRQLECRCNDLYTAMYLMTFVAIHNEDEYRECGKEGCHNYFLVDKTHPQTLCDLHMESRRRKRRNQRKYQQEEDTK